MRVSTFLRYILLPAVVFSAGAKAGVEYAKKVYVSKDRKFIEGEVVNDNKKSQ